MLTSLLQRLLRHENLSEDDVSEAIASMMTGQASAVQIASFLTAMRSKGETADEILGAAQTLRSMMEPLDIESDMVVDTCGTGGDGSGTFNISTAAAVVAAAAGVPVAKHGNRSITSKTGSADVLAELGVNVTASVSVVEACLDELGICFCFAPQLHPSMKHVAAARKKLGVPTIFNMIGPLCNPASAPYQLLGVGRAELTQVLSAALTKLETQRALVVRGDDGLDEVTLNGRTQVVEVVDGDIGQFAWRPADFGLQEADRSDMQVNGPEASAAMIRDVLAGAPGPPRDIVVLNAAAALWTARRSDLCYATTNRQAAVNQLAREADLLLVVGSENSSNTQALVRVARMAGIEAHRIDSSDQIDPAWLEAHDVIGVTSGASAPDQRVREVVSALNPDEVRSNRLINEDEYFPLPPSLRTFIKTLQALVEGAYATKKTGMPGRIERDREWGATEALALLEI